MATISAVIITYNEEFNVGRCIDSVKLITDEVIVVDLYSSDRTEEISRAKGALFYKIIAGGSEEKTKKTIDEYRQKNPVIHCGAENSEVNAAAICKKAIALAQYEYIIMVDEGVVLNPDFMKHYKKNLYSTLRSRFKFKHYNTNYDIEKTNLSLFNFGFIDCFNVLYSSNRVKTRLRYNEKPDRARPSSILFWKKDAVCINGFDEDFPKWDQKNTELIA